MVVVPYNRSMKANMILAAFHVLDEAEKLSGRLEKEALLEANRDNLALQGLLRLTYNGDKYHTYPSSRYQGEAYDAKTDGRRIGGNWGRFERLLTKLHARKVTGQAAQDAVDGFLDNCYVVEKKWYGRVLGHDLKIGIKSSTINKVWDPQAFWGKDTSTGVAVAADGSRGVKFPGTMLCTEYKKAGGWDGWGCRMVEPKLDGYRLQLVMSNGQFSFFTRGGKCDPYNANLAHLVEGLQKAGIDNIVLDCEVMHDTWGSTGCVKRKNPKPEQLQEIKDKVKLYIFDAIEWTTDGHKVPLRQRKDKVCELLIGEPLNQAEMFLALQRGKFSWKTRVPGVEVLIYPEVTSEEDLFALYNLYTDAGFEGAVIKDPIGEYNWGKRGLSWIKLKPLHTTDAKIIGFESGKLGGANEHRLGALVVREEDGKEYNVGGGYSFVEREAFWAKRNELVGHWIEVVYQKDDVAVARFPQFKRMRTDRNPDIGLEGAKALAQLDLQTR